MPTLLERRGDFSQSVDAFGAAGADRRSGDRAAVSRQRHPAVADQPAGRGASSATTRQPNCSTPGGPLQLPDAGPRGDASGRAAGAAHADAATAGISCPATVAYQRTTTDTANVFGFVDSSARLGVDVADQLVAPLLAVPVDCGCAISSRAWPTDVTPYFAEPRRTCPATPASPATTRIRSTGVRRA